MLSCGALAGRTERAAVNRNSCFIDVSVGHDNHGVLTAHLAGHLGSPLGSFSVKRAADSLEPVNEMALSTGE